MTTTSDNLDQDVSGMGFGNLLFSAVRDIWDMVFIIVELRGECERDISASLFYST